MKRKSSQEILSELEATADGLTVRRIGIWTLEKLAILLLYFQGFTNASAKASGGFYVDGLAGPGLCEVRGAQAQPKFVWGSPLIALRSRPRFQRCLFVELDKQNMDALTERTQNYSGRRSVIHGDVNVRLPQVLLDEVPRPAPCFCLLDPEGTELSWNTVESAAGIPKRTRKPELLVLFPSASLLRLLPRKGEVNPDHAAILDRMMPGPGWRNVYEQRLDGTIAPDEAKERYVELYRQGVEDLGYKAYSRPIAAPSKPGGKRRERYQLIFATEHEAGEKIMLDVFRRPYVLDFPVSSQPPLFE